jgi:hypothetical protein
MQDAPGDEDLMCQYVYAYRLKAEAGEMFFRFPKFPEIITAVYERDFRAMTPEKINAFAHGAVVTALQGMIAMREPVPVADDPKVVRADGFVRLTVVQSMKLQLYKLYQADKDLKSVADLARMLKKPETAVRRLLNLWHNSRPDEIDAAVATFGKRLVHDWGLEAA